MVAADPSAFEALSKVSLEAKLVHRAYAPLYANGAFADMFLYDDPADVQAQTSLLSLFDSETRADPQAAWAALLDAPGAIFGRRVFNRRNGALFRAEFLARRVRWADGPAVAIALLDVSEEERACRALAGARAEAESTARARRGLFAAAARSLTPPMRAARTQLRALAQSGGETAELARNALDACDAMLSRVAHVGDLLNDEEDAQPFELRAVLERAGQNAMAAFPDQRLSLRIGCPPESRVLGAPQRLERAAFALIECAAVRAADVAFTAVADREGLALQVEARGLGAGAPDAPVNQLALARALAEAEGGVIVARAPSRDIWSAHAYLPLALAPEVLPQTRACAILVVEDNPTALRLTRTLLMALGHSVSTAGTGAEAIAAIAAQRFDLVLMDVHLPGMDGLEATRRIRALALPWAGVPIAALTASASEELRAGASEAGMDAFLLKPIDAGALARQIALLTGSASVEAAEFNQIEEEDQHDETADEADRNHLRALP